MDFSRADDYFCLDALRDGLKQEVDLVLLGYESTFLIYGIFIMSVLGVLENVHILKSLSNGNNNNNSNNQISIAPYASYS